MTDLGAAIHWQCRDCDFKLDAPNSDAARMPAVAHYIKTGHMEYKPRDNQQPARASTKH
jgi:hypothetical protein